MSTKPVTLEVIAQTTVESLGFEFTPDLRGRVMLRLGHAQVTPESQELVTELVTAIVKKTPQLTPRTEGTVRTASVVNRCPRCSGMMVSAKLDATRECDYCQNCRVTIAR